MFSKAIKSVSGFVRPVFFISRFYKNKEIIPNTATLFFVNDEGVALTCKHVANEMLACSEINGLYDKFNREKETILEGSQKRSSIRRLEENFKYNAHKVAQSEFTVCSCVKSKDDITNFEIIKHEKYDIAILKFKDYISTEYMGHAIFAKDDDKVDSGDFLCRLGYPFPEFTNYKYNDYTDKIEWTKEGKGDSPWFPMEGMCTRYVTDADGKVYEYELSTPGLLGQSGGPLFNQDGVIFGMQSNTSSIPLGFNIENKEFNFYGEKKQITNYPFLHVGRCITFCIIKKFLSDNKIKFYEGSSINEANEISF